MVNGISVGHRRYEFLAYSASQLKKGSFWTLAPVLNSGLRREQAADEGDVYVDQRGVWKQLVQKFDGGSRGKFASRQGQAFSSTTNAVQLRRSEYCPAVPDIMTPQYIFVSWVKVRYGVLCP